MAPPLRTEHDAARRPPAAGTHDDERRPPAAVEEPHAAHPMLALQREAGNAAVSRLVARQPVGAPPGPVAGADLADFMSRSYIMKNVHPSTGRGLFDVAYEPTTGEMTVTVRVCFNFKTGNILDPDWLAAVGGFAGIGRRGWKAEDFIWTDEEKAAWAEKAIGEVQNAWSEQYVFHSQKPGWESLPAVHVNVLIQQGPADKSQWVLDVNKYPVDSGLSEAMTIPDPGSAQSKGHLAEGSRDEGGILGLDRDSHSTSTTDRARYGQVDTDNPGIVFFDQGKSAVTGTDLADLQKFGATLGASDMPPFPVTVTGHASSEGEEKKNLKLSEDRARNVANEIVKAGAKVQPTVVAKGEQGATEDPTWRMVEIDVKDFTSSQTTVVHEFGHILGLGDEYSTADATPPTRRPVGTPVAHSALAQRLIPGQQPIVAHESDSIMSTGESVRPYHYVTFLEALGTVTGTTGTWGIRPGPGGPGRQGPGDFPAPPGPDDPRVA
ncbi:MAG TPA: OmpA family protein [Miltoncostaeaceae bacterium]|nr:OmpA family protein [Miltoncostaeaceae bacterium]